MNIISNSITKTALAITLMSSLFLTACSGTSVNDQSQPKQQKVQAVTASTHEQHPAQEKKATVFPAYTGAENQKTLPDGQSLAAYKLVNGVKEFHLTAMPVEWETKDGEKKVAWTYNGTVPGPQIRVTEGDKVRIVLENKLPEATTLHWHGIHVPNEMDGVPGVTQDPVQPGETFVYEFTANPAGTHMYHTHTNTMNQVDKGLFGTFIIDPKNEKKTYDKDFALMLSDGSMGYLINGKSYPATVPYKVNPGEKVRVRLMNIGNQVHPMHLHGHDFKIVAKDGHPIPEAIQMTQDTLDIMPGDTYDIEFVSTKGTWLFHCHVLPHVHQGHEDTGMIQVVDVK